MVTFQGRFYPPPVPDSPILGWSVPDCYSLRLFWLIGTDRDSATGLPSNQVLLILQTPLPRLFPGARREPGSEDHRFLVIRSHGVTTDPVGRFSCGGAQPREFITQWQPPIDWPSGGGGWWVDPPAGMGTIGQTAGQALPTETQAFPNCGGRRTGTQNTCQHLNWRPGPAACPRQVTDWPNLFNSRQTTEANSQTFPGCSVYLTQL